MTVREPLLHPVAIADLRPTQITVGFREVKEKLAQWNDKKGEAEAAFLGRHMVPVVTGPKGNAYVLDHHHLCRALHEAGQTEVLTTVTADLSHLTKDEFWVFIDNRAWCHPYDAAGERQDFKAIPKSIAELTDDPYRSLAGELRRAGGYSKNEAPFSEFIWADFLRRRVGKTVVQKHFSKALTQSLELARGADAAHLPGWCGPSAED